MYVWFLLATNVGVGSDPTSDTMLCNLYKQQGEICWAILPTLFIGIKLTIYTTTNTYNESFDKTTACTSL